MFKHTQTIRCLLPTNCLRVFDHFVRLALRELRTAASQNISGKLLLFGSANKTFILLVNYLRQNFLRKSITATAVNIFLCQSFILRCLLGFECTSAFPGRQNRVKDPQKTEKVARYQSDSSHSHSSIDINMF